MMLRVLRVLWKEVMEAVLRARALAPPDHQSCLADGREDAMEAAAITKPSNTTALLRQFEETVNRAGPGRAAATRPRSGRWRWRKRAL